MAEGDDPNNPKKPSNDPWGETQWTLFVRATSAKGQISEEALDKLFRKYEPPIAATIRRFLMRTPWVPVECQDLVHEFFMAQFQKKALEDTLKTCREIETRNGEKLKLRQFLSRRLDFFLKNRRRYWRVRVPVPPDPLTGPPPEEPKELTTGATRLDREWAIHLIRSGVDDVRKRYAEAGKGDEFKLLEPSLRKDETAKLAELAKRSGTTVKALGSQLFRLRRAVGESIMARLKATLVDPTEEDLQAELKELFRLFEA
ncbi:MAG TPA: hypothetical protein VGO11_16320 [Chthoniobacteraceae bacterium]|jgi:hypothetical protein|nr:hypothetical protein [Chthoniobacteraceae bacterium]